VPADRAKGVRGAVRRHEHHPGVPHVVRTYSGIVPDGIESLGVEDLDWAGDSTILVRYLAEKTRLQREHDRASRVLAEIDRATATEE
jgi:hypothetical protein